MVAIVADRTIVRYYDRLASEYDAVRFGNSYGRFIDTQERAILAKLLPAGSEKILDLGCGTGRLVGFATHGGDASIESLKFAAQRHPDRIFVGADAAALPFRSMSFDAAFSFHLLMHLKPEVIAAIFAQIGRLLKPGGIFVADVASGFRRRLHPRRDAEWHGATSLTRAEFRDLAAPAGLRLRAMVGVGLFPVHRIPRRLRPALAGLDRHLAALVPGCASYLVGCFEKARP
jgi:SAM-dependent methyltransferase